MKCTKHTTAGKPCKAYAITGRDACPAHVGEKLALAKAKGEVVVTVRRWMDGDVAEEPGALLLKLMTATEWKRQAYELEIEQIIGQAERLSDALVGDSIVVDGNGSPHTVGEYIRGIVQLEQQERRLAAELSVKAVAAGLAERAVRLEERRASMVVDVLRGVLADVGIDPSAPDVVRIVSSRLRAIESAA